MFKNKDRKLFPPQSFLSTIRSKFSFHYVAYTVFILVIAFSVIRLVSATTPNPGHPWIEVGDGVFTVTNNQTAVRAYTFPDANATVLTTNDTVTVPQGGTGATSLSANSILYGNGAGAIQALAVNAGGTACLTQTGSGVPAWGSCGSVLSDGDKGDVTVSGGGTAWTIDNLAVTNAQINDVAWSKVSGTPTTIAGYGITDAEAPLTFSGPLTRVGNTISIPAGTTSTNGYLTSSDWNIFNGKQPLLSGTGFVKSTGGVISYDTNTYITGNQSITLSGAVTGSGTTAISTTLANNSVGIANLSATGTPSNSTYLRGDNTWATLPSGNPGTVTSFAFTNGGGFTGVVTNATSTPTLSLTLQDANGSQNGQLTAVDWNTFNNKQDALSGTGFVKSTAGVISYDTNTYLTTAVGSVSGTANRITSTGGTNPVIDISPSYIGQSSITTVGTITSGVWNGTAIANANLANSSVTIGTTNIALGATSTTLTGLTSVDATTFTGSLTGVASGNEVPLTFSMGLTRTSNTITNNLSTGITGGQSVVGGTGSGENLILSSTSNATKGNIVLGTTMYDEVNDRLNFGTTTGVSRINFPDAGTTAADGISFGGSGGQKIYHSGNQQIRFSDGTANIRYLSMTIANGQTTLSATGGVGNNLVLNTSTTNPAGISIGGTDNNILISKNASSAVALVKMTQNNASTTGPILELANNAGTVGTFGVGGILTMTPTDLTGALATSILDMTQTWNTSGTPSGIKLNVTNTASNAASNLLLLQTGGNNTFRVVASTGALVFGSNANNIGVGPAAVGSGAADVTGTAIRYLGAVGSTANAYAHWFSNNTTKSATSGVGGLMRLTESFGPTSGTGEYSTLSLLSTINQTGGANGITRGLYINPTLTAAADFRAIETTQGTVRLADTYTAGSGALSGSLLDLTQTWNTSGSPTAIKLNVTNTGSGASANLIDLQIGGASKFKVDKNGIGTITSLAIPNNNISFSSTGGLITAVTTAVADANANFRIINSGNISITAGSGNQLGVTATFNPSSGMATFGLLNIYPTINQTGGAGGATRGIYINPTLIAAADWRAIELASGDYGNGAAGQYILLGRNTNATNTGAGSINFLSKAGTAGYVWQDAAGNMRINTAAPTNANDTAGTVIGAQTSTRETKQDIADYSDYAGALTMVLDAPLHTFKYIKEVQGYGVNSPLAKTRIGYIADEVNPAFMVGNVIDQVSVNGLLMASIKALDIKINGFSSLDVTESGSLGSLITQFFADQAILIKNLTVSSFHINDEICVDDVCATKEEFKALLLQAKGLGSQSTAPVTTVGPTTTVTAPETTTPAEETPTTITPDTTTVENQPVEQTPDPITPAVENQPVEQTPDPITPAVVPPTDVVVPSTTPDPVPVVTTTPPATSTVGE